jgi:DNA-binding LacI/PurR family transcriptional regulator
MGELLSRTELTAVFAASDVIALGAIGALRRANRRVPEDVSIVGFDDIPLAAFFDPPLTTVRLPAYELGHAVGAALLDRISDATVPRRTLLPTELVVRASTRASPSPLSSRRDH